MFAERTVALQATGKLKAVTTVKAPLKLPADAIFEDYVEMSIPEDAVSEVLIDPLSMQGMGGGGGGGKHSHNDDGDEIPDGLLLPEVGVPT